MEVERCVLYTTVYPGLEKYLSEWYESVLKQTDCNFDIWIGVDELKVSSVISAISMDPSATWIIATKGDTPAQIRQKAIQEMVKKYEAIIFVDSDDILEPTRIEAARDALVKNEVNGCALKLIDEKGYDLGINFKPQNSADIASILPFDNVFGFTNTAYRAQILRKCLPIPEECVLVDWFLITKAWTLGAYLDFDFTIRMAYRQHPQNIARVLPPFSAKQILLATEYVLNHYKCVLTYIPILLPQYRTKIEEARKNIETFYKSITSSQDILNLYVSSLNQLSSNHIWWDFVAHPQLEEIWKN